MKQCIVPERMRKTIINLNSSIAQFEIINYYIIYFNTIKYYFMNYELLIAT